VVCGLAPRALLLLLSLSGGQHSAAPSLTAVRVSLTHAHPPTARTTAAYYAPPSSWNAVDAAFGGSSNSQESILVKAVLIRAAYGGMAGDVEMLCAFAGIWTARFSGQTLPPPPLPPQQQQQQPGQQQQQEPDQQQQPHQHQQTRQLPGRKGAADCSGAPSAASPWLLFLRQLYAQLPAPGPAGAASGAADATRVTAVKALSV
jgi:hypothetical protein